MTQSNKLKRADFEAGRIRFLDAADEVFLREGYTCSTIRLISAEAKTSLARLNRHWSGKEHLFQDVFARHFNPIHEAQNRKFDELEKSGELITVGNIVNAFFSPALTSKKNDRRSHLLYCRALVDPSVEAKRIAYALLNETRMRVISMLRQALHGVDEDVFFFTVTTVLGAYLYPQLYGSNLAGSMKVDYEELNWERAAPIISKILEHGVQVGNQ